jgi:hypothetical protein
VSPIDEDLLYRMVRQEVKKHLAGVERALNEFAIAGAMFYPGRCDVGLVIRRCGLETKWRID